MAAIIAIHDLNLGARYADSIVMLREGTVFSTGKADELYTPEMIEEVYGVKAVVLEVLGKPHVIPVSPMKKEPSDQAVKVS